MIRLTDDLQLIEPIVTGTVAPVDTMTLYYPVRRDGGRRAYIRFSRGSVEAHRLDKYTHVLIQATRKDVVLHFLDKPKTGAHPIGKLTKKGREISSAAIVGALQMQRGDHFRIDFTAEGSSLYASWPRELQERINGATQIRRVS